MRVVKERMVGCKRQTMLLLCVGEVLHCHFVEGILLDFLSAMSYGVALPVHIVLVGNHVW